MKLPVKRLLCLALALCLCAVLLCFAAPARAVAETEVHKVTVRIGPNGLTPGVWRPVSELYATCTSTGAAVNSYGWYTTGGTFIGDKFGPEDCYLVVTLSPTDGYVFGETVTAFINNSEATCVRESDTSVRVTSHVYTPIVFAATVDHHPQGETVDPGGWANFAAIGTYTQEQEWFLRSPDGKYFDLVDKVIDQASRSENLREDEYPVPHDFVTLKITGTDQQNLILQNIPADMDGWQVFCRLWCYNKLSYTDTRGATITVNQPSPTPTPEPTEEPPEESPEPTEEPAEGDEPVPGDEPEESPEPTEEPAEEKEHVHEPAEEWSKDDDYHWHACTGCDEPLDKAAHEMSWTVTTPAGPGVEGEREGVCSVCGYATTRKIPAEQEPSSPLASFDGTLGVGLEGFRYFIFGSFGAIGLGMLILVIGAIVRGVRNKRR